MDLQYTLETYALQLKNVPRTLVAVTRVVQKMMKTLYDTTFQRRRTADLGGTPIVPTATFSPSDGCLNTSQKTPKTQDTPFESGTENGLRVFTRKVALQS